MEHFINTHSNNKKQVLSVTIETLKHRGVKSSGSQVKCTQRKCRARFNECQNSVYLVVILKSVPSNLFFILENARLPVKSPSVFIFYATPAYTYFSKSTVNSKIPVKKFCLLVGFKF